MIGKLYVELAENRKKFVLQKLVNLTLDQVSGYAKENILLLPNKMRFKSKFAGAGQEATEVEDPYKGKQMVYVTDVERNFVAPPEDEFFITSYGLYKRKIFGIPTVPSVQET